MSHTMFAQDLLCYSCQAKVACSNVKLTVVTNAVERAKAEWDALRAAKNAKIASLEKELDDMREARRHLQMQLDNCRAQRDEWQGQGVSLRDELEAQKKKTAEYAHAEFYRLQETQGLKDEIAAQSTTIETLKKSLADATAIETLKKSLADATANVAKETKEAVEAANAAIAAEVMALRGRLNETLEALAHARQEIKTKTTQLHEATAAEMRAIESLNALSKTQTTSETKKSRLEETIHAQERVMVNDSVKLEACEKKITVLQKELNYKTETLAQVRSALTEHEDMLAQRTRELYALYIETHAPRMQHALTLDRKRIADYKEALENLDPPMSEAVHGMHRARIEQAEASLKDKEARLASGSKWAEKQVAVLEHDLGENLVYLLNSIGR